VSFGVSNCHARSVISAESTTRQIRHVFLVLKGYALRFVGRETVQQTEWHFGESQDTCNCEPRLLDRTAVAGRRSGTTAQRLGRRAREQSRNERKPRTRRQNMECADIRLWRVSDTSHDVSKARIRAQGVEHGLDFKMDHVEGTLLIRLHVFAYLTGANRAR
jgi:hypothetical protein